MLFTYNTYYSGRKEYLDKWIYSLIEKWLDEFEELSDIIKKLEKTARDRWVILKNNRLEQLKYWIQNIEEWNCEYIERDSNNRWTHLDLLFKFIDIIHSLSPKNDQDAISEEISWIIADVLNTSSVDTYRFITNHNVFQIFQTMHGDVDIQKKQIIPIHNF